MQFLQDTLYALRAMRKNPVFTATTVFTLALGIGAPTAMFTVIRAVLLKPLAYRDPDRLVRVAGGITTARYDEILAAARSFSEIAAFRNFTENVALSTDSGPEALKKARVSANFLHVLGVEPALGRSFRPEEDAESGPWVVMIAADLWRRRFHNDPAIAGKTIDLDGAPYTILGVLPDGFAFPFAGVDLWLPRPKTGFRAATPGLVAVGRLNPGVSINTASAEAEVLHRQYAARHPGMLDGRLNLRATVVPLKEDLVGKVRSLLWMLLGAVGFVLLIACANVAGILLARASYRSREFAVRAAIGASRSRMVAQLLTESVLLALAGGALGVLLARWSLAGITHWNALELPRTGEIRVDGMVLGFAMALSVGTGILFGLVPSWSASHPDLAGVLRGSLERSGMAGDSRLFRLNPRSLLVIGQVSLSMVLLIGAALLIRSMANLARIDPGFQPDHLLTMRLSLAPTRYSTAQKNVSFFDDLIPRLQGVPGVREASVCWVLPFTAFPMTPVQPTDRPRVLLAERPLAALQFAAPSYFRTLGIPLRRGREFAPHDNAAAELVAIVNEKFARDYWPAYPAGVNPVGQQLMIGVGAQPVTVIGIVADMHQHRDTDAHPTVYRPWAQGPMWDASLVVRTHGDPLRLANAVRGQLNAIDRDQPVYDVRSMEDVEEAGEGQRRLILKLLEAFGALALTLTMVGLYGVTAYSVAQRTRELGIRRALGATNRDIVRLVVGRGLAITSAGVLFGIGGALALTRLMQSLLFHVSATDPLTFTAIGLLLIAMALAACYIPARRAASVNPMTSLRVS